MLNFHNTLYTFWENAWFLNKYELKNNQPNKMQITFFLKSSKKIDLTMCVIQVFFLFMHAIATYE